MTKNILVAISAFFLTAVLCDFCLQYLQYRNEVSSGQKATFYSYTTVTSDGKPLSHRPGLLKLSLHPALVVTNLPQQSTESFSINASGFRGPEIEKRVPGRSRIVITGGSAAFGAGVRSDKDTLNAHLEKLIPNSEIINAGTYAHRSGQELVHLVVRLLDLKPDIVVSFSGWNDMSFHSFRKKPTYELGFGGFEDIEGQLLGAYHLSDRNFFVRGAASFFNAFMPNISKHALEAFHRFSSTSATPIDRVSVKEAALSYAENMLKMSKISEAFGARFLCVIQPDARVVTSLREKDEWSAQVYDEFRLFARNFLLSNDVRFIDLNDFPNAFSAEMFLDAVHLNSQGYASAAKTLFPSLEQLLKAGTPIPNSKSGELT